MTTQIIMYIITTILGAVIASLIGFIKYLLNKLKENRKDNKTEDEAIKQAVKSLLRAEIKEQCNKYIQRGYLSADEYEELMEDVKIYEALDGNGLVHKLVDAVKELPIK